MAIDTINEQISMIAFPSKNTVPSPSGGIDEEDRAIFLGIPAIDIGASAPVLEILMNKHAGGHFFFKGR